MTDDVRLQFDVACALGLLAPEDQLPFSFPGQLNIDGRPTQILTDCVDPASYSRTSCRIRSNLPEDSPYHLYIGNDKLTLASGGSIFVGGSGVTVQLYDPSLDRHFALKAPRVSVLAYDIPTLLLDEAHLEKRINSEYRAFETERHISRRLFHQHIAQHFYGSSKQLQFPDKPGLRPQLPYSVSEWIEGAQKLHEFILNSDLTAQQIVQLLYDTFSALSHVHSQQVIHWDLKSDNVLVSSEATS